MSAVQILINDELNVAGALEDSIKTERKEAAAKIYTYWIRKRESLIARKLALKQLLNQ